MFTPTRAFTKLLSRRPRRAKLRCLSFKDGRTLAHYLPLRNTTRTKMVVCPKPIFYQKAGV